MDAGYIYNLGMGFFASMHRKTFNVFRPDYTRADSLELPFASSINMRVNTIGQQYAQRKFGGLDLYTVITGLRECLQEGDVIVETCKQPNIPAITIYSMNEMEDVIAMRTGRIGRLTKDIDTVVYTHVRFDFTSKHSLGTALHPAMQGSLKPGGANICIHPRADVDLGWRFVDDTGAIWRIDEIEDSTHGMFFDCSRDDS